MFENSSLFGTNFPFAKTAPKIRGFDKDIGKQCIYDAKTLSFISSLLDEDIMMNLIRFNRTPKLSTLKECAFFKYKFIDTRKNNRN
jgi:hypothetical protein